MGEEKYFRRARPSRKWRRLLFLLGCLLLILAIAYAARTACSLQSFHNREDWAQQLRLQDPEGQRVFLVYGVDYWGARPYVERLILLYWDMDKETFKVLYLPGNTLVGTELTESALGQVYRPGDVLEFIRFVEEYLHLPVHHYLQVSYEGLAVTDELWGEIAVRDLVGALPELIPEGKDSLGGFELYRYFLTPGYGETALQQLERQRQVLITFWNKLSSQSVWGRPRLFKALSPYLETDLSWRELQALHEQLKDYSFSEVEVIHLPGSEEIRSGRLYWVATTADINRLGGILRGERETVTELRVEILNGSGVAGQAAYLTEMLTEKGLQVVKTGNAGHFSYQTTEIIALGEDIEPAREVAAYIPGSIIVHRPEREAGADVRVIIGSDYLQAGAAP